MLKVKLIHQNNLRQKAIHHLVQAPSILHLVQEKLLIALGKPQLKRNSNFILMLIKCRVFYHKFEDIKKKHFKKLHLANFAKAQSLYLKAEDQHFEPNQYEEFIKNELENNIKDYVKMNNVKKITEY